MPREAEKDPHVYAEYLKERMYGLLTLMAVNVGLLVSASKISVGYAAITISVTAFGLWSASMLASYLAYRVAHDAAMPRYRLGHEMMVHRGLLFAALPSLVMLVFAAVDWITLATALLIDIVLAGFTLTLTVFRSAKTAHNSWRSASVIALVQLSIILMIVFIKSSAK